MSVFRDRIAIVTGGASGIGRELARALGRHGADVVIADVQVEAGNAVAAEIKAGGGRASAHLLDVTDRGAVESFVTRVASDKGRLDYMFNNAGIAIIGEFRDLPAADWERILSINVGGVFAGTAAAYAVMIRQGSGHIVNTASVAGLVPAPGLAAYCASKHAVVGLSTALRAEAAQYGVKVSAICPGFISTPIFDSKMVGVPKENEFLNEARKFSIPADQCAARALKGVAGNRAIIPVTGHAHVWWRLNRFAPDAVNAMSRLLARRLHAERVQDAPG